MDPIFLTTIAVQVGSSLFNCLRGNKNSKALAERQRAYEEKVTREGIDRAKEEFAQICVLQREMEQQLQADRLNLIKKNYQDLLTLRADEKALQEWPLFVPPYVVKNECILDVDATANRFMLPLNCILTSSAHRIFNQRIFPKLEEWLAIFCTGYWNVSAEKTIRFFQGAWRDNSSDVGAKIYNLFNGLSDVPTFVLSPVIRDGKVLFRFYWWGLSQNPNDIHIDAPNNIFDPELGVKLTDEFEYTEDDINEIVNELGNKLAALVSFFADMYYINYYHICPSLPGLLYHDIIKVDPRESQEYYNNYTQIANGEWLLNSGYEIDTTCEIAIASFKGMYPFLDKDKRQEIYYSILSKYFKIAVDNSTKASELKISLKDFDFVRSICTFDTIKFSNIQEYLDVIESLENNYSILDSTDTEYLSNVEDHEKGIALYRLYQIFEYSIGGKYNPDFASKCLSESTKLGFVLAVIEQKIQQSQIPTNKEILSLEILHNSSIQSASILLAKCYFRGLGVIQDEEIALDIINSNKGPYSSEFYYNVAMLLIDLYGEDEQTTIMSFLGNASKMGYVKAMEKLMMIYKGTKLAKEDPEKHFLYAKQAAERGSIVGLVRTGYCYAMGYGVPKSIPLAKPFLTIAANHGSEDAKKILSILNLNIDNG